MPPEFTRDELDFKHFTANQQPDIQQKYDALGRRAQQGLPLASYEQKFYCGLVRTTHQSDAALFVRPACDDYLFISLLLTYYRDLTGGSLYVKPRPVNGQPGSVSVPLAEVQRDLSYLENKAAEWERTISITQHSAPLLHEAAAEARYALKQVDNLPDIKGRPFIKGTHLYYYKRLKALLQSKYVYLMAQDILCDLNPALLSIPIGGVTIELTEYSFIHILNRHFARDAKAHDLEKSYHTASVQYRGLAQQLQEIFHPIEQGGFLQHQSIEKIALQIDQSPYLIYTSKKLRYSKGNRHPAAYTRLNTFFPVEDPAHLQALQTDFELTTLTERYGLYLPRPVLIR